MAGAPENQSAVHKLDSICKRLGLTQASLAAKMGVGPSSLSYYFPVRKHYEGRFLPAEKPWSGTMARVLIDSGATEEDIQILFGRQILQNLGDFRGEVRGEMAELKSKVDRLLAILESRDD